MSAVVEFDGFGEASTLSQLVKSTGDLAGVASGHFRLLFKAIEFFNDGDG